MGDSVIAFFTGLFFGGLIAFFVLGLIFTMKR